jgi:homoaconitase/3-isopropylmalate dehydratase large subunit
VRSRRHSTWTEPYYASPGDGIFHFYFPSRAGLPGADSSREPDSQAAPYGAYGAIGIGVGSTTLGFGLVDRIRVHDGAPARRVVFAGRSSRGCRARTSC